MTPRPRVTLTDEVRTLAASGEPHSVLVVDFVHVSHATDPRFLASLHRHLDAWIGPVPHRIFGLPGPKLVAVAAPDAAQVVLRGARQLAGLLHGHGFGNAAVELYELPRDLRKLAATLPEAAMPAARSEGREADGAGFGTFLDVERALQGADISSFVREQPVCSFAEPARPHPVFSELWVSLAELERRLGVRVRDDPHLLREVTDLTDVRMLRHLLQDRSRSRRRFSVNLHVATVLHPVFLEHADGMAADFRRDLIVELPGVEAGAAPERAVAAVDRLRDLGMRAAFDLVPPAGAAAFEVAGIEVDFIKITWPGKRAQAEATSAALGRALERWGAQRLVLCRCDDEAAVAAGLAAGVLLLQGRGVSSMLDHPGRAGARPAPGEVTAEDEPAAEPGPPPRAGGWWSRLFHRS